MEHLGRRIKCPHCQHSFTAEFPFEAPDEEVLDGNDATGLPLFTTDDQQPPLFTSPAIDGIVVRLDVITTQCVAGISFGADIKAAFSDFFGGRSKALEKELKHIHEELKRDLRKQARRVQADAVISIHFQFGQISGNGGLMLWGAAQGTPVILETAANT